MKPSIIQIEPVVGCNFNCIMCRAGETEKKFMEFDSFRRIIDEFTEAFVIVMNFWGEPFLHRDILKMIRYASSRAIVNIYSNFSLLPNPEEIINSGLYEIHASVDSFDEIKFSWIRERGKLRVVVENLQKLIETRERLRKDIPIISINSVLAKENIEDAERIIERALEMGVDRVKFQRLLFNLPDFHVPSEEDRKYVSELRRRYRGRVEVVLNNFEDVGDLAQSYCYLAYFMMIVRVNGEVFPCCMPYPLVYPAESCMGNIFSDTAGILERRESFIRSFRSNPAHFCRICPIYYRSRKDEN